MEHKPPLANAELRPQDRLFVSEIPKLRKMISAQGLVGLANDTKWNELITTMRSTGVDDWVPMFRFRCIDSDFISAWDAEWWHHLPFPFISVLWFEITFIQEIHRGNLISSKIIDHSETLENLLNDIGFELEKGVKAIRLYGYAPKNREGFIENA